MEVGTWPIDEIAKKKKSPQPQKTENCRHRRFFIVGIRDDRTGRHNTILTTMAKKAIPAGIGAVGKTKMKNLHPSQPLKDKYGTAFERDYLEGLEVQRADKGRVSRAGKVIDRFHVTHPDFPKEEFLIAKRLFSVVVAPAQPFEPPLPPPPAALPSVHQQATRESSVDSVGFTAPAGR